MIIQADPPPSRREPVFADQRTGPAASLRTRLLAISRPRAGRRGLGLFAGAAILTHLVVVGLLVGIPAAAGLFGQRPPTPPPEQATVALVMQNTPSVGGSKPSKPAASAAPKAQHVSPAPPTPTPLSSPNASDAVSTAASAAASSTTASDAAAQNQSQQALASAEINLDSDDSPGTGIVSGDNVVPASPDDRHKNVPPIYPVAAEERGEQGSVVLVVTIAPDGHATDVEIASSSGHKLLDDEARRAVSRWHFRPAIKGGKPVESFFNEEIDFDGRTRP